MNDPRACRTCGDLLAPHLVTCPRDGTAREASPHEGSTQSVLLSGNVSPPPQSPRPEGASGESEPDALTGQRLGDYVVCQRLGTGGMGVVYAGKHVTLGSQVAIKFIREEHARGPHARTLLSEARTASAIRHRGIIDVFGFGEQPGVGQYLVMEYLAGRPLTGLIRQHAPLEPAVALPLLCEVLDALSAAHAVGVIHRDLKPSNIFVVRQSDGSEYIKVLDFGLAKRSATPDGLDPQTRSDLIVGTPQYMSPEQALCEAVSPQTDLYAVGVIAFELLTGRRPFTGRSQMEVVAHHINSPPPAPSSLIALPPELDALVLSLLAKAPAQRPASASQVSARLRALASSPLVSTARRSGSFRAVVKPVDTAAPTDRTATLSPPAGVPPVTRRSARRSPWAWGAVAVASFSVVTAMGVVTSRTPNAPPSILEATVPPLVETPAPPRSAEPGPRLPSPPPAPSTQAASPTASMTAARPRTAATVSVVRKPGARASSPPASVALTPAHPPAASAESTAPGASGLAATGVLHLSVRGAWADVVVDGQRLGRVPPLNRYPLTAGEHELELHNPNLETYRQRLVIPPQGTLSHVVDFSSAPKLHPDPAP